MAKFRLRDFIAKHPRLERARVNGLASGITHGLSWLDESFNILRACPESAQKYVDGDEPCIFAIYHGRMAQILRIMQPRSKFKLLVSQSRDGEITTRGVTAMGFDIVRGSTGKGAVQATKQLVKAARDGYSIVVTVDGPRGPNHEVKPGIIRLAQLTDLPLVPSVAGSRHYTKMWGWDTFMATQWGSEYIYMHDHPIFVPKRGDDAEREEYRLKLENAMYKLYDSADSYWDSVGIRPHIDND